MKIARFCVALIVGFAGLWLVISNTVSSDPNQAQLVVGILMMLPAGGMLVASGSETSNWARYYGKYLPEEEAREERRKKSPSQ